MKAAMRTVTLRRRLLLLAVAGILPLALMSGAGLLALAHQQREAAGRASLGITRALATAVDAELKRSVAVLETLVPTERAVFVLREVFDVPYAEIAEALDKSPAAVRQIATRARKHVAARRPRMSVHRGWSSRPMETGRRPPVGSAASMEDSVSGSTTAATVRLPNPHQPAGSTRCPGVIIPAGTTAPRGRPDIGGSSTMVDFLLRRDEEGQTLAEYALILALIAILAILALLFLGGQINAILSQIGNAL